MHDSIVLNADSVLEFRLGCSISVGFQPIPRLRPAHASLPDRSSPLDSTLMVARAPRRMRRCGAAAEAARTSSLRAGAAPSSRPSVGRESHAWRRFYSTSTTSNIASVCMTPEPGVDQGVSYRFDIGAIE